MNGTEPRRILLSTDAVGGVWTYAQDLARGLSARGTEVLLAVLGPAPSPAQRASLPPEVGIRCTGLPLDWTAETPANLAHAAGELAALARSAGVDLVHLHTPALASGAAYGPPVVASAHSCVATWWRAVRPGDLPQDFAWRRDAVAAGLQSAALTIVPSEAFAGALRREYGGGWACRVVRNGRAMPAADASSARNAVLTAGRLWDEGKGAALLDRVAACGRFAIDAAGPTAGPNGVRADLHHLNLLGTMGERALRQRMREAAIFASPALYEPFGLSVLEAAQEGAALVLSDIPTFRELWDGAALFVPPAAADAWHECLWALLRDPALTETLGARAGERSRRYSADAMIEGTLAGYRAASRAAAMAV
ncbi:MAG: glycosyltransferase family 4 protein [Acetobacteraceae bacterium]|nr:glycosyltransferase family 4 protein [Acetobacteraceae bacterium]